jgi:hypothetical protein
MKFKEVRKSDWFKKPEMTGHIWAKEKVELIEKEMAKFTTVKQKSFLKSVFDFNSTDWYYFQVTISKNFVKRVKYVVKRFGKEDNKVLLRYAQMKGGFFNDSLIDSLKDIVRKELSQG